MDNYERRNIEELLSMHPSDCNCCHCPMLRELLRREDRNVLQELKK